MKRGRGTTPLPWLGGLLLVYLAVPVVAFCVRLIGTHSRGFHDPGLFPALATSVLAASISTAVITVLGVPLAYVLARSRGRLTTAVGVLVQLPLAVPPVMSGILLIYIVGPDTAIGRFFGGALTETLVGIVLAQTFVAAPFLVVTARAAFGAVDTELEDVAATLGHGGLGRFFRVALPVAAPGVRAGMVLAWLRAFGEYGATVILAYHPTSLPVYTFTQFSARGLPGTMAPTALALAVAVVCVALSRLVVLRVRRRRVRVVGADASQPLAPSIAPTAFAAGGAAPVSFTLDHRVGGFRLRVAHHGETARLAVLGPSGSGKSTLLRCLAGLYGASPGEVSFGVRRVEGVPAPRRRVGYVAQHFSLFPHLTVWEQVLFGSEAHSDAAGFWLGRLGLGGFEDRLPSELSGGQRQRVALAQALATSPAVLLLDEPFSALDTPVRAELRRELRRVQREAGISTVVVTHDPEEAALLADEVLVVETGRALQEGRVRDVYGAPTSPEAARLLGVANAFAVRVAQTGVVRLDGLTLPADTGDLEPGTAAIWAVPPARIRVLAAGAGQDGEHGLGARGVVEDAADLGTAVELTVRVAPDVVLRVRDEDPVAIGWAPGDGCTVTLPEVTVWPAGDAGAASSDAATDGSLSAAAGPRR
jgi:ABC-type Fe3+/spermidine/putrescine transport system ATPase subunit/ABC-type sulfate transport system permease component